MARLTFLPGPPRDGRALPADLARVVRDLLAAPRAYSDALLGIADSYDRMAELGAPPAGGELEDWRRAAEILRTAAPAYADRPLALEPAPFAAEAPT